MKLELIATATFGLEAVVKRELQALGFRILRTEDGKVTFLADERGIIKANLWLRCADRVLLKMGEFEAKEFEDLFQQTGAIEWESLIPLDGKFTVTCTTVKSKLHSEPAIQRIVKKSIAKRLGEFYGVEELPETGAEYTVKATLLKDRVTLTVDTSGTGLHKRGYRVKDVAAPIKETLAAAMVQLSFWKKGRILVDPCCGSGTIPIEAAMIGRNIAPGLGRHFACEEWDMIGEDLWKEEKAEAFGAIDYDTPLEIYASDINGKALEAAKENAEAAGVEEDISFKKMDVSRLEPAGPNGIVVTNPPYGERIGDEEAIAKIYKAFGRFFRENPDWSLFMITTDKEAEEKVMGRQADRRRKLYNGRLETCYYQFHGIRVDKN